VEEEIDWSKVDKKTYNVLEQIIKDYREGTEFLLKNGER